MPIKKTIVVLQSNYIPWRGYFDLVKDADLFIFHDDLQYTKNDWRNRNKIRTSRGADWLTIPVGTCEKRMICEVKIVDPSWQKEHWAKIKTNYREAPFWKDYYDFFQEVYLGKRWDNLSDLNQFLVRTISKDFLGIKTDFADSRTFNLSGKKLDRLIELLKKAGATKYISGPAAKDYIDESIFEKEGIELKWKSYEGYPEYRQVFPGFEPAVSIIDLLFNLGDSAQDYIWGWREKLIKGKD